MTIVLIQNCLYPLNFNTFYHICNRKKKEWQAKKNLSRRDKEIWDIWSNCCASPFKLLMVDLLPNRLLHLIHRLLQPLYEEHKISTCRIISTSAFEPFIYSFRFDNRQQRTSFVSKLSPTHQVWCCCSPTPPPFWLRRCFPSQSQKDWTLGFSLVRFQHNKNYDHWCKWFRYASSSPEANMIN